jgi:hypothetical protein
MLLAAVVLPGLCLAQADPVPPPPAPAQEDLKKEAPYGYMAPSLDAYQGNWNAGEAQRSASLWKALCDSRPADVNAQFNWFRSERNARLSTNNGTLNAADEKELNQIADRIQNTAPGSFEQHLSSYYVAFPERKAFAELQAAKQADAQRPELILPMINQANLTGDVAALDIWCAQAAARGGLSPALANVAQDLLASVDRDGVVFLNGDMDVTPVLVQQRTKDLRRDVLVVDQRLLGDAAYRQRIWTAAKATGPVPSGGPAFAQALHKATARPVFLALSLDRIWFSSFQNELCPTGIAFALRDEQHCDNGVLLQRWKSMRKDPGAGPLSRNYLLPGSVLLQRARAQADGEKSASQLEFELRTLAKAMGATQDLIKAGVLIH